jgi:hypothetical protein
VRVLLGWLFLFGLAAFAGWGTANWRAHARERGDAITRVQKPEAPGIPATVLIGGPSTTGTTNPTASSPRQPAPASTEPNRPLAPKAQEPRPNPRPPAPFELKVRPGSSLSRICQDFYDEPNRPPLTQVVEAVARWNHLASPNDLRAGELLELPTLELLFP